MEIQREEHSDILARWIETGDLGSLSKEQLARYYRSECERLGLDPMSRPFDLLRLQGKLVLYATRRCADQLAAKHRVTRTIVDGPEVRDFGGTKLLYCKVRVSTPDGRTEEDVATLPATDLVNAVMKIATKAARRATLKVCGWGELDESEIETVPGAERVTIADVRPAPTYSPLDALRDDLASAETTAALRAVYEEHRAAIAEMDADGVALKQARDACHAHATAHGWARTKADTDRLLGKGEAPPALDVRATLERYGAAASVAEVEAVAADLKGVKLAKEARDALAAAHDAALSRIYCADAAAWDARLAASETAHEVARAFLKRTAAFDGEEVLQARWERTAARLAALGVDDPAAFVEAARAAKRAA